MGAPSVGCTMWAFDAWYAFALLKFKAARIVLPTVHALGDGASSSRVGVHRLGLINQGMLRTKRG